MTENKRVNFKRKKKRSLLASGLLFVITIILITAGSYYLYSKISNYDNFTSINIIKKAEKKPSSDVLVKKINDILKRYPDLTVGVSVINADGETLNLGVQKSYTAASTTKVLTAVAFLNEVEEGNKSLEKIAAGYTYEWHIKQMINRSNNNSWELLNEAIGYPALQAYARSIGINTYQWNGNTIAPSDEAILLKKLADGKLINNEHRELLYGFMQNTNTEDLISPAIPEDLTFYHKYGILDYHLHDTGTITGDGKKVHLVVMTKAKKTIPYEERAVIFQDLAKAVIDYNWPKS